MGGEEERSSESGLGSFEVSEEEGAKGSYWDRFRGFPIPVFAVFGSEFTERFSYFCMTTVLSLYMINVCGYSEVNAVVFTTGFGTTALVLPIFGAILADGFIGKYHTILWLSCLHMAGSCVLAFSALQPKGSAVHPALDIGALLMIAIGTGGIKASVAPFGGDQFKPGQEEMITLFFSIFYFMINLGAMLSSLVTPLIRVAECFEEESCYPGAFGLPAILMVFTLAVFASGTRWYTRVKAEVDPVGQSILTMAVALGNLAHLLPAPNRQPRDTWVEHRLDSHECAKQKRCTEKECWTAKFVTDVRGLGRIVKVFATIPFYWAIYQQGSNMWFIQSMAMKTKFSPTGGFQWLPDQMQFFNAMLILVLIPVFAVGIYPLVQRLGLATTPLRRMCVGGCVMPLAFFLAAWIQTYVDPCLPAPVAHGHANLYVLNNLPCNVSLSSSASSSAQVVGSRSTALLTSLHVTPANASLSYTACSPTTTSVSVPLEAGSAFFVSLSASGAVSGKVHLEKSVTGKGQLILGLAYATDADFPHYAGSFMWCPKVDKAAKTPWTCGSADKHHRANATLGGAPVWLDVDPGAYSLFYLPNNSQLTAAASNSSTWVYTGVDVSRPGEGAILLVALAGPASTGATESTLLVIAPDNEVHILWQVPQWFLLTVSEILFSITGLEMAYTQSPNTMKSVVQAFWLVTMALGQLIAMGVEEAVGGVDQAVAMTALAAAFYVIMAIFIFQSWRYTYSEYALQGGVDAQPDPLTKEEEAQL